MTFSDPLRLNDIPYINKHLEALNEKLQDGDTIIVFFESKEQRKERILKKYAPVLSHIYYFFDFILKRIFPKWKLTQKIFYKITKGRNRVLSTPEVLGRVVSCGYKILEYERIGFITQITAIKVAPPTKDTSPTYGALIKLTRVGRHGTLFFVYKFRTMHPFSEYIQEFIFEKNQLQEGGKIAEDFRVTSYGRWMRRLWLDEFPMFYNLFRGDMKLIGVRPLSRHFFSLYPEDMQKLRTQFKPGLIPPFYADLPKNLEEVIESERKYLNHYSRNPWKTDWIYFWKAMNNIFIKRARSN